CEGPDQSQDFNMRRILILTVFICVYLRLTPALAVTPAVLIGPDLEGRRVTVSGLHDGQLSVFDENRTLQTLSPGEYLQLRFVHEADDQRSADVIFYDRFRERNARLEQGADAKQFRLLESEVLPRAVERAQPAVNVAEAAR